MRKILPVVLLGAATLMAASALTQIAMAQTTTKPPAKPMMIAGMTLTKPAPGVMHTRPATQPEAAPSTVGLPCVSHS